ncbi:hypothetical protein [Laceyella tengchongensis]|uniref:hypothetical protein n=1 Tax=Laceyella tengchongensis TaxID=574699 RepID=UPI001670BD48|nr:hypothetical protein [Laceyella tengchongensis]
MRKVEQVVGEMLQLYKKYGVRKFKFVDDLFIDPSKKVGIGFYRSAKKSRKLA